VEGQETTNTTIWVEEPHKHELEEVFHHYSFEKYVNEKEFGLEKGKRAEKFLEAHSYFPKVFAPYIIP
jgi:hypothetical protein